MNLPVGTHSARPFPFHSNMGNVPWWLVEIAYVRESKVCEALGEPQLFTLVQLEAQGIDPLWLLDVLAGGVGNVHAEAWCALRWSGGGLFHRPLAIEGIPGVQREDPIVELARLMRGDARPFPTLGDRDTAGNGIAPGTIPRWLAELLHEQWSRVMRCKDEFVPPLERLEREGGFPPMFLLDVPAGGDGRGMVWQSVQRSIAGKLQKRGGLDDRGAIQVVRTLPRRLPEIK